MRARKRILGDLHLCMKFKAYKLIFTSNPNLSLFSFML